MRSRLWLVFVLLAVLLVPCKAFADDFETRDLQLVREQTREQLASEEATPQTEIEGYFNNSSFTFLGRSIALNQLVFLPVRIFTTSTLKTELTLVAIGIVFMWWGVRKAIRMIFRSFRKGGINV